MGILNSETDRLRKRVADLEDELQKFINAMDMSGWRQDIPKHFMPSQQVSKRQAKMLRPIAETLAMLDGNAFFEMEVDHWKCYLPEAKALFEGNGGLNGWAGGASFAIGYRKP